MVHMPALMYVVPHGGSFKGIVWAGDRLNTHQLVKFKTDPEIWTVIAPIDKFSPKFWQETGPNLCCHGNRELCLW